MVARSRRISRRSFLVASGGALVSLGAFGCGGGGGNQANVSQPESTTEVPPEAQDRTRVVFWTSFGDELGATLQRLVDDFNGSQDDIFVENQFQGSYEETAQKLATAMQARQIPDMVILSEVTWNRFYLNESLQSLSGYFGDGFSPDAYVDSLIGEGTRQNEVWWVPFARSTPLFYYNRDMFSEAGLPDRGPETWDELRGWGEAIMGLEGNPKVHALTTAVGYNAWYFHGNVWQWGGNYSDGLEILIDEAPAIEAGEWMRRFVHEDNMAYMAQDPSVEFTNGLAATTEESTGSLGGILETANFEVGTSMLPEQRQFGCPTGGSGIGIMAAAPDERKQAAFEFIKFAGQPDKAAFWSTNTGYMPVVKEARDSQEMQSYFKENPNFRVAVDQLAKTQPQDLARTIIPNGDTTIGGGLERIYANNDPADRVFANVAQQLERDAEGVRDQAEGRLS
jgi:sn-glycerol 3-phosphate transport system substrate-binding protein